MAQTKTTKPKVTKVSSKKRLNEDAETIPVRIGRTGEVMATEPVVATAPIINRTAKTIQPLDDTQTETPENDPVSAETTDQPADASIEDNTDAPVEAALVADPEPANDQPEVKPATTKEAEAQVDADTTAKTITAPEPEVVAEDTVTDAEPTEEDTKAAADKQAAAADKRQAELEALVASGQYYVPINAVRRKRSRMLLITSIVLVLVAAVAVDALADLEIINLPAAVPHTDLFDRL